MREREREKYHIDNFGFAKKKPVGKLATKLGLVAEGRKVLIQKLKERERQSEWKRFLSFSPLFFEMILLVIKRGRGIHTQKEDNIFYKAK